MRKWCNKELLFGNVMETKEQNGGGALINLATISNNKNKL